MVSTAASASAQQRHSTQWRTKKADADARVYHSTEAQREFFTYSTCVAKNRYAMARDVVLARYASSEQSQAARKLVRGRDDVCLKEGVEELRMSFGWEVLVGGVAQALVRKDYPQFPALMAGFQIDPADESARLAQLNAAEIFGRCVVQRDPAAAFALFSATPASREEREAVYLLRDDLGPCLAAGSTIKINEMFLRNSMGVAAYRLANQIQPLAGAESASRQ